MTTTLPKLTAKQLSLLLVMAREVADHRPDMMLNGGDFALLTGRPVSSGGVVGRSLAWLAERGYLTAYRVKGRRVYGAGPMMDVLKEAGVLP